MNILLAFMCIAYMAVVIYLALGGLDRFMSGLFGKTEPQSDS